MSRKEHDREDLLKEATALVERVELLLVGQTEPVVAGFRRDASASVYFGAQPAYHFNSRGELRRAFSDGLLFKAEKRRLASLRRCRSPGEVTLARHDLSDPETACFLEELTRRLTALRQAIASADFTLVGQVPAAGNVIGRLGDWLAGLRLPPTIAQSPVVC
jgi:hypothetical protein